MKGPCRDELEGRARPDRAPAASRGAAPYAAERAAPRGSGCWSSPRGPGRRGRAPAGRHVSARRGGLWRATARTRRAFESRSQRTRLVGLDQLRLSRVCDDDAHRLKGLELVGKARGRAARRAAVGLEIGASRDAPRPGARGRGRRGAGAHGGALDRGVHGCGRLAMPRVCCCGDHASPRRLGRVWVNEK